MQVYQEGVDGLKGHPLSSLTLSVLSPALTMSSVSVSVPASPIGVSLKRGREIAEGETASAVSRRKPGADVGGLLQNWHMWAGEPHAVFGDAFPGTVRDRLGELLGKSKDMVAVLAVSLDPNAALSVQDLGELQRELPRTANPRDRVSLDCQFFIMNLQRTCGRNGARTRHFF